MIRLLKESDRGQTVALLSQAPEFNLYLLGNLTSLGFDNEITQFWGDFDPTNRLRAVLNRYMSGWVVFGQSDADWASLGQILDAYPVRAERLQDNPVGIESFLPYLKKYRAKNIAVEELMSLKPEHFSPMDSSAVTIRRATVNDLDALADFYANAGHMSRTRQGVEQPLQRTRIWLAEEEEKVVSTALTNAETDDLAMIGGVYTTPNARGRGLSQVVCSALCQDLLNDQKRPVLYWETPAAGAVYRKLGFQAVGQWRAVLLDPL
ncbi:GNAT family N-acetyltransferase [Chloroflexi bacterium TSY]|nr:GNAT family N-acetyltransferase [Chloroflexi bacterium TSY]